MANPSDQGAHDPMGPAAEPLETGSAASSAAFPAGLAPESHSGQPGASLASDLKKTAQTASEAVGKQAAQFAQDVGHELSETGEVQKRRGAEAMRRFARAIDSAAAELESQSPAVARAVHETARRVDGLSDNLSSRNVNELIDSAAQLARAQPALFIGGSVAAGFALARFLKSSARQRSGGPHQQH
jgi:hypothetical protein